MPYHRHVQFVSDVKGRANHFLEYTNLVERLGNRGSDFWSAYMHHQRDRDFRPVRLLKLPLVELPQARLPRTGLLLTLNLMSIRLSLRFEQSSSHHRYRSPWPLSILCNGHRACLWTTSGRSSAKRGTYPSD